MKARLTKLLDEAGIQYESLPHAHTETAMAEAQTLGLEPDQVAKTLVLTTPLGFVRAVIPASGRLDLRKIRELLGVSGKQVGLASEDDLARDYAEFELGAVPPFGGAHSDRVLFDRGLAELEAVTLEAGSHDESIRIRTADLLQLTQADVADICQD